MKGDENWCRECNALWPKAVSASSIPLSRLMVVTNIKSSPNFWLFNSLWHISTLNFSHGLRKHRAFPIKVDFENHIDEKNCVFFRIGMPYLGSGLDNPILKRDGSCKVYINKLKAKSSCSILSICVQKRNKWKWNEQIFQGKKISNIFVKKDIIELYFFSSGLSKISHNFSTFGTLWFGIFSSPLQLSPGKE